MAEHFPIELSPPDIGAWRTGNTGVDYVHVLDSGSPGPSVMVQALTHGNEFCGAIALDWLFRERLVPARGRLTVAFANVEAYARFDFDNPDASRCIDEDYNRVWADDALFGPRDSLELRRAHGSKLSQHDLALRVDDDGERQCHDGIAERLRQLHRAVATDERRVVEADLLGELPHLDSVIDGDADKLQPFGAVGRLRLDEHRHLFLAGRAPRGPEIDNQQTPSPLRQALWMAVDVGKADGKQRPRIAAARRRVGQQPERVDAETQRNQRCDRVGKPAPPARQPGRLLVHADVRSLLN